MIECDDVFEHQNQNIGSMPPAAFHLPERNALPLPLGACLEIWDEAWPHELADMTLPNKYYIHSFLVFTTMTQYEKGPTFYFL